MANVATVTFVLPYTLLAIAAVWFISRNKHAPRPLDRARPKPRELRIAVGLPIASTIASWLVYVFVPNSFWNVFHRPEETFLILTAVFLTVLPVILVLPWLSGGLRSIRVTSGNVGYSLLLGLVSSSLLLVPASLYEPSFPGRLIRLYWPVLVAILVAGFGQELLFRGVIQTRLEGDQGMWEGLFMTAALFELWHIPSLFLGFGYAPGQVLGFLALFLPTSILFGYLAQLSDNLLGSIIYHFVDYLPYYVMICPAWYCLTR